MKKILLLSIVCSTVLLFACNDGNNSMMNDDHTDAAANEDNSSAAANIQEKKGLPLGPDQEVPVNNSTASGTMDVAYNKDSRVLTYTVSWSGLTDAPTMAHIHGIAARGANAGVVHDLTGSLEKAATGSFTNSVTIDESTIKEDSLLSGFYYINIHTAAHPGGEIRGQIEF